MGARIPPYMYEDKCHNSPKLFEARYGISSILHCILNNISVNDLLNILDGCKYFENENDRFKPITEVVTSYFMIPDHLSDLDKAKIYLEGYGDNDKDCRVL